MNVKFCGPWDNNRKRNKRQFESKWYETKLLPSLTGGAERPQNLHPRASDKGPGGSYLYGSLVFGHLWLFVRRAELDWNRKSLWFGNSILTTKYTIRFQCPRHRKILFYTRWFQKMGALIFKFLSRCVLALIFLRQAGGCSYRGGAPLLRPFRLTTWNQKQEPEDLQVNLLSRFASFRLASSRCIE